MNTILNIILLTFYFLTAFYSWEMFDRNYKVSSLFLSVVMTLIFFKQYFKTQKP